MKKRDIKLLLEYEEFRIIFYALNELRSEAIKLGVDKTEIDELMIRTVNAARKRNSFPKRLFRKRINE